MSVLVDYRCAACGRTTEVWTATPPTPSRPCPHCGASANRIWSPFGIGRTTAPRERSLTAAPRAPLCVSNPDVPGLCHMTPAAGRAWLARARKDGRALERELERQEKAAVTSPPTIDDVVSHHHSHLGHSHTEPSHQGHSHAGTGVSNYGEL